MASVYRRKRRDGTYHKRWSYWYVDHNGKRQTGTGTPDKTTTRAIAERLEAESSLVRAGLEDAMDRYCRTRSEDIRDALERTSEHDGLRQRVTDLV